MNNKSIFVHNNNIHLIIPLILGIAVASIFIFRPFFSSVVQETANSCGSIITPDGKVMAADCGGYTTVYTCNCVKSVAVCDQRKSQCRLVNGVCVAPYRIGASCADLAFATLEWKSCSSYVTPIGGGGGAACTECKREDNCPAARQTGDPCGWAVDGTRKYECKCKRESSCSETNVAPTPVTTIQFCTESTTNCSDTTTVSTSPTIVVNDNVSEPVYLKALGGVIPTGSGSRGLVYKWTLDDLRDSYNCANPYDACSDEDVTNISTNIMNQVVEGHSYKVTYWVGTLNKCNSDIKWSQPLSSYFKVDYTPEILTASINGQSGTETDDDNALTCSDNNPFTFTVRYRDKDGVNDLRSLVFWIDDAWPNSGLAPQTSHGLLRNINGVYSTVGYECDGTCSWGVTGVSVPNSDPVLCTDSDLITDLIGSDSRCISPTTAWSATSIRVVNANVVDVTYKIWLYEDIGDNLNIYLRAWDKYTAKTLWIDSGDWIFDKNPPDITISDDPTIVGSNSLSFDWSVTDDLTGVSEIRGSAYLAVPGLVDSPIDDETSGITEYLLDGSDPRDLWFVSNPTSRTETINLKQNEGNQIGFTASAVDGVCNMGDGPTTIQELDSPWTATRGGYIYSQNGTLLNTRSLAVPGHKITENKPLWYPPYRFHLGDLETEPQNNDIALSSELYLIGTTSNFETLNPNNNPAQGPGVSGVVKDFSGSLYKLFYDGVIRRSASNVQVSPIPLTATSITGNVSDLAECNPLNDICVFYRDGDLQVSSTDESNPFTCDRSSIFLVTGQLIVDPDIVRGSDIMDGCVFVVSGDVTINEGANHADPAGCTPGALANDLVCYPPYDKLEAMILTDGKISIKPNVEILLNEGLLVHGSLIAQGIGESTGIIWQRSLKLINNARFPSLVVHYDPVHLGLINRYVDMDSGGYVKDVGFKSY